MWTILALILLTVLGGVLIWWDVRHHRLPNALVATLAVSGLLANLLSSGAIGAVRSIVSGVAIFTVVFILYYTSKGKLGAGDVKLAAAIGVLLGPLGIGGVALWLLVALATNGVIAGLGLVSGKFHRDTVFAYGPAMIVSAVPIVLGYP